MALGAKESAGAEQAVTVSEAVVSLLYEVGVRESYGVCGRENVPIWGALLATIGTKREIATRHARHENGAGYAAVGSWMQTGRPTAIYSTSCPGVANTLTSLEVARAAGAKLVMLSPLTPAAERDRLGIQETGPNGYANPDVYRPGRLFDVVAVLESPKQLQTLAGRLANGLAGPGGFAAHVVIPTDVQVASAGEPLTVTSQRRMTPAPTPHDADELAALLAEDPFAVWVGWGARHHAPAVRRLLDLTGAGVLSSPRGRGIADHHPGFLGVTGNGGHDDVVAQLARSGAQRVLVLGSALSEPTSGWLPGLVPPKGFVHVDLDSSVFGHAYPAAATVGVQADVGAVLDALLARADALVHRMGPEPSPRVRAAVSAAGEPGTIHPTALMAAIQRTLVDTTDMPIFGDASSAMFHGTRHLVFETPGRWLVEGRVGAMGWAGAAVVGAASGRGGPAAAICGDGAMHMQDEIGTAVRYDIRAIWIVLNDAGLGIVRTGMRRTGRILHDADYPPADFAAVARAKGAEAARVTSLDGLDAALEAAMCAPGPFLVDVLIDRRAEPPIGARAKR
jgi:acetolactate synthase I/II/III large subunit